MEILIILHLLAVVLWIGGVGFVTMVVFPTLQTIEDPIAMVRLFQGVERRFSRLAKVLVIVVGITGILLFFRRGGFGNLYGFSAAVLGFKTFIWLFYTLLLFGVEERLMKLLVSSKTAPEVAFKRMSIFHWVVLILSLLAIAGGVALTLGY